MRSLVCLLAVAAPLAGTRAVAENPKELDPIVVVASKSPRPMSEVAGQVSVIDAEDVGRHLLEGMGDLLRYEPGLETESSGTRFGVSSFNIRGIGGNRVAIEVDGVPVRDHFMVGNYSNGGRELVETDRIKRLEVLFGPASTLYGSDALGGVLSFITWDPEDLLGRTGGERYFSLRVGHRGADSSWLGSGMAAWGDDRNGVLIAATSRHGRETENRARAGSPVDARDWDSRDHFLRLTHDTATGGRVRLTAGGFEREAATEITSILGFARFARTTRLTGKDRDENHRLGIDYEFSDESRGRAVVRAFTSRSRTRQLSREERAAAAIPVRIERAFHYTTELSGMDLSLFRRFSVGGSEHRLGAGIEYLRTKSDEFRDGFQQTIATGLISHSVLGENFPVRDFPVSVTREFGVFVQDEIRLGHGWELIPAVRWDHHDLEPRPDAVFRADNPAIDTVSVSEAEISPRLGVLRQLPGGWSVYGQYVRGFRAPPFEDANIGLDIPLFNIRAIPNPELRSETSSGFEFGLREFSSQRRFSLALFATVYDDFIESRARIGVDPASGVLLFQSRNIGRARIFGLDLRLDQDLGAWRQGLEDWALNVAAYWSEGENRDSGEPLNSVSPPQAVIGLTWRSPARRWDIGLTGTFTARQDRIDHGGGERLETPGHGVVDVTAGYRLSARAELRFGVRNLGDRRYWRWSDVSGFSAGDPMLELLTRPGRNYSFSLRAQW